MGQQGRFGPPPYEVVHFTTARVRGLWRVRVSARREGQDGWEVFTLDGLGTADCLEALHTEVERRLIG